MGFAVGHHGPVPIGKALPDRDRRDFVAVLITGAAGIATGSHLRLLGGMGRYLKVSPAPAWRTASLLTPNSRASLLNSRSPEAKRSRASKHCPFSCRAQKNIKRTSTALSRAVERSSSSANKPVKSEDKAPRTLPPQKADSPSSATPHSIRGVLRSRSNFCGRVMIRGMFRGHARVEASTGQRSRCHTGQHLEGRFPCIPYTLDGSADGGSCVG